MHGSYSSIMVIIDKAPIKVPYSVNSFLRVICRKNIDERLGIKIMIPKWFFSRVHRLKQYHRQVLIPSTPHWTHEEQNFISSYTGQCNQIMILLCLYHPTQVHKIPFRCHYCPLSRLLKHSQAGSVVLFNWK